MSCTYMSMKILNRDVLIVDLLSFIEAVCKNYQELKKHGVAEAKNQMINKKDDEMTYLVNLCNSENKSLFNDINAATNELDKSIQKTLMDYRDMIIKAEHEEK